jgi:hypothetical protein
MDTAGAYTALLNEAINGRLHDTAPSTNESLPPSRFYWCDKYDDLLLKFFYEVKTRATSQQGFKANHNLNAAKLITQAFQVRGLTAEKVKYRLKELKARYKVAKSLAERSGWDYDAETMMIEADNAAWEEAITANKENLSFRKTKLWWFPICDSMWLNDVASGGNVMHSTDPPAGTSPGDPPSPPIEDDSPDISPGPRRKRAAGSDATPAQKTYIHEHNFSHEKAPLTSRAQAVKIIAKCNGLSATEQKEALKALKAGIIDDDFIIGLDQTPHLVDELKEGISLRNHLQKEEDLSVQLNTVAVSYSST